MGGDLLTSKVTSPTPSPREVGGAAIQWVCTKRGRMVVMMAVLFSVFLGLAGMKHREVCRNPHPTSMEADGTLIPL